MLEVTAAGSHESSQVLTRNVCILILSAAEIFRILSVMTNCRIIFKKKNCLFDLLN